MDWTCKKCGKTLEVSEEQLHEMQGVVICPQCLGSERVPGYRHKASTTSSGSSASNNDSYVSRRSNTSPVKSSPPPYRKKTNKVEKTSTPAPSTRIATTPKKKKKKRNKRGPLAPHSSLGCLWRAVLYTILLLGLVTAIGFILDYI